MSRLRKTGKYLFVEGEVKGRTYLLEMKLWKHKVLSHPSHRISCVPVDPVSRPEHQGEGDGVS